MFLSPSSEPLSCSLQTPKSRKQGETDPSKEKGGEREAIVDQTSSTIRKMGLHSYFSCIVYIFLLATLASAYPFLSDDIFESGASTGRSLLQAKKDCSVNFENQNYTILTSQCKGPQYPPKVCCEAFKQFACPFTVEINDMTTNCASTMFSYINVFGKYPPGLFANQCKEGKQGLDCSQVAAPPPSNSGQVATLPSLLLITTAGFLVFFFHLF